MKINIRKTAIINFVLFISVFALSLNGWSPLRESVKADSIFLQTGEHFNPLNIFNPFAVLAATISTDKADYIPGEIVEISGTGFAPGETVTLQVVHVTPPASTEASLADHQGHDPWYIAADSEGNVSTSWLVQEDSLGQTLLLTADGQSSGEHAETTFTDAGAAIRIGQCHNYNGAFVNCTDAAGPTNYWGSGNAQSNNARLSEGDNQNFRAIMTDIPVGSYTLDIELDLTKGGKVAYDRYSSPARQKTAAAPAGTQKAGPGFTPESLGIFPCINNGVANAYCTPETGVPVQIPAIPIGGVITDGSFDNDVINSQTNDIPEYMFLYGNGNLIMNSAGYSFTGDINGDSSLRFSMTISKTVESGTLVLAWGGHVSKLADYTTSGKLTATSINGSPYHMRLKAFSALNGSPGNQDMQMASTALVAPPQLKLVKTVTNDNGGTAVANDWDLTATGSGGFTETMPGAGTATFRDVDFDVNYALGETGPDGYSPSNYSCVVNGGAPVIGNSITLASGDSAVCTINNDDISPTITVVKTIVNDNGGTVTDENAFGLKVDGGAVLHNATNDFDAGAHTVSETGLAGYAPGSWGGDCNSDGSITLALDQDATCTITNDDISPTLTVIKTVVNDNGGTAEPDDFNLTVDGGAVLSGATNNFNAGGHTAAETLLAGYSAGDWGGDCAADGSITLALDQDATCTITNDDIQPTLTLVKTVVNDNGGTLGVSDFPLFVDTTGVTSGASNGFNAGSYTASETTQAGYAASDWGGACAADGSVTLAVGDSKTCTITNDDIQPTLTLVKTVVNDNGGTLGVSDFPLFVDNQQVGSGASNGFNAGSYTASETTQAGYAASDWGGACAADGSVTLAVGDSKTCTITNDDIQPTLTLVKTVVNDNGGTLGVSDFPLFVDTTGVTSGASNGFNAGSYTASETTQAGYAASDWGGACAADGSVTLAVGDSKTCTITNDDIQPMLTVIKHVVNDSGGSAVAGNFTMNVTGTNVSNPTFPGAEAPGDKVTLDAGTYSVDENPFAGYTKSLSAGCSGSIAVGEMKTCTITNDDDQAFITVVKTVTNDNGGVANPDDFNLTLGGNATTSGTQVPVNPGTYTAGETLLAGYTFEGFSGDCDANGDTTVALGESKTCTLTNNDQQAYVTVVKTVTNDNGGVANPDDFNLTLGGNATTSGTQVPVNPGTYTAGETLLAGYTFEGFSGDCDANGDTTVALGESKTCTLTNNDQQAYVTVVKTVTNDNGGVANPDDFNLTLGGNATTSGTQVPVNPGTYAAAETLLAGYTFEGFSGDCDANGDTTVALGESKTCTLTNNDQQAYVTVVKTVTNDNGGVANPDDFNLTLGGNATTSGTQVPVNPGTYTAGETLLAGYTFEGFSGDCDANGDTTVALGESKTCTLTNNDQQAYVTVVKTVTNDNGGVANPDDFNLTLGGNATTSGTQVPVNPGTYAAAETLLAGYTFEGFSGDCDANGDTTVALGESKTCTLTNNDQQAYVTVVKTVTNDNGGVANPDDFNLTLGGNATTSGTQVPVNPGTYAAAETLLAGYTFEGFSGDCDANGDTTVALGESKTCTLTNNDQQAYVTVVKTVTNDNGGVANPDDFNLTLGGNATTSGTQVPVNPGTYAAAETLLAGYTFEGFSGDCDANGDTIVALGESKTCTLTNNDIAPTLTLIKNVVNDNGGTLGVGDFPLFVNATPVVSGVSNSLSVGSYTASETTQAGYAPSIWGGDCAADGTVTLALAENKVCSITNNDIQPKLIVIKHVINDDDGTAVAGDFTMEVTGNNPSPASFDGEEAPGTMVAINAGAYSVDELMPVGPTAYAKTLSADCTGSIAVGETKTCTVTNDDLAQTIVTSSSLCTFDVDSDQPGNQFRLLYTPDQSPSIAKLNASNPGQYYYNVFYAPTNPGTTETVKLTLPYPFVTHGATPIHVYGDDTVINTVDGQRCITPGTGVANSQQQVVLGDYDSQEMGSTAVVEVTFDWPAGEDFIYLNIHLDYGLKKTTGYSKNGNNDAVDAGDISKILIPDGNPYLFSAMNGVPLQPFTVYSQNNFKKIVGVGGMALSLPSEDPVVGAVIELWDAKMTQKLAISTTDADGWYLLEHKHRGRRSTYMVKNTASGNAKEITLKSNGYAHLDFP